MKVALLVSLYVVASLFYAFCNVRYVNSAQSNLSEVVFWSDYYTAVKCYAMFLVALPYLFKRKLLAYEMNFIYFVLVFNTFNIIVYIGNRIMQNNITTTPYFFLFITMASAFVCLLFNNRKHGKG